LVLSSGSEALGLDFLVRRWWLLFLVELHGDWHGGCSAAELPPALCFRVAASVFLFDCDESVT
jgi:hypothetical protein